MILFLHCLRAHHVFEINIMFLVICPRCSSKENSPPPKSSTECVRTEGHDIASSYYICQLEAEKGAFTREQKRLTKELNDTKARLNETRSVADKKCVLN